MKSGKLNFLEPSGPLQACNGTVLPFFTFLPSLMGHTVDQLVETLRYKSEGLGFDFR